MKTVATLIAAASLLSATSAQITGAPACVNLCLTVKFTEAGSLAPGVSPTNIPGLCGTPTFVQALANCLVDNCSQADLVTGVRLGQQFCASNGGTLGTAGLTGAVASFAATGLSSIPIASATAASSAAPASSAAASSAASGASSAASGASSAASGASSAASGAAASGSFAASGAAGSASSAASGATGAASSAASRASSAVSGATGAAGSAASSATGAAGAAATSAKSSGNKIVATGSVLGALMAVVLAF